MHLQTILSAAFVATAAAQQAGYNRPENHPPLPSQTCTSNGCTTEQTSVVLDANWRWTYSTESSTNCYTGNTWDRSICTDPATCAQKCAVDGADYTGTYGVRTNGDELSLQFVTNGPYSNSIGSRVYLMENDNKYKMFKLLNKEFTFDVDVSQLECGLNGALYFVDMAQDGGLSDFSGNNAGAKYGTGYCDAQCPHDIKFINGEANILDWTPSETDPNAGDGRYGTCCMEMDIWEANKISNAFTTHPCDMSGPYRCDGGADCGTGEGNRYKGVCDRDGCDFNPYRMNVKDFYGPGNNFDVDTNQPMTVVTQFITDDNTDTGKLVEVRRLYKQNGRVIQTPDSNWSGIDASNSLNPDMCEQSKTVFDEEDDHGEKGGLARMGEAMENGMVLALSLWVDHTANLLWLDSNYPTDEDPSNPGVARGTCPTSSGVPQDVINQYPRATVKFSNIKIGEIDSTY